MSTLTITKLNKLKNTNLPVSQKVNLLRSAVIGLLGKDKEGNYNPLFVQKAIQTANEKSVGHIKSPNEFLNKILKIDKGGI